MDLKRKLSSRKFWLCVCSLVGALLTAFNLSGSAAKVTAIIMAFGSVISYIIAEGWVDAANVNAAGVSGENVALGSSDLQSK